MFILSTAVAGSALTGALLRQFASRNSLEDLKKVGKVAEGDVLMDSTQFPTAYYRVLVGVKTQDELGQRLQTIQPFVKVELRDGDYDSHLVLYTPMNSISKGIFTVRERARSSGGTYEFSIHEHSPLPTDTSRMRFTDGIQPKSATYYYLKVLEVLRAVEEANRNVRSIPPAGTLASSL